MKRNLQEMSREHLQNVQSMREERREAMNKARSLAQRLKEENQTCDLQEENQTLRVTRQKSVEEEITRMKQLMEEQREQFQQELRQKEQENQELKGNLSAALKEVQEKHQEHLQDITTMREDYRKAMHHAIRLGQRLKVRETREGDPDSEPILPEVCRGGSSENETELEEQRVEFQQQLDSKEQEIRQMTMREENREAMNQAIDLAQRLKMSEETVRDLKEENQTLEETCLKAAEEEIKQLMEEQRVEFQQQLDSKDEEIKQMRRNLQETNQEHLQTVQTEEPGFGGNVPGVCGGGNSKDPFLMVLEQQRIKFQQVLDENNEENEQVVSELKKNHEEKEQVISELKKKHQEEMKQLQINLEKKHEEKEQVISELKKKHEEKEQVISELKKKHEEKDQVISELKKKHEGKEQVISELKKKHEEKEQVISELKKKHQEKEQVISELKKKHEEKEQKKHQEKEQVISELKKKHQEKEQVISELKKKHQEKEQVISELKKKTPGEGAEETRKERHQEKEQVISELKKKHQEEMKQLQINLEKKHRGERTGHSEGNMSEVCRGGSSEDETEPGGAEGGGVSGAGGDEDEAVSLSASELSLEISPGSDPGSDPGAGLDVDPLRLTVKWNPDDSFTLEVSADACGLLDTSCGSKADLSSVLLEILHKYKGQAELLTEIQALRSSFAIDWRPAQRCLVFLKSASVVCELLVEDGYPRRGSVRLLCVRREGERGESERYR
ncbi:hypothetical protein WMY93_001624 [Mugilogobius chulae]|uniref:Uncharacterized protein n=1 Tax=Mugilogobius chulae TaxID=88201 RepID=A0AAW0PR32_9GOBI